MESTKKKQTEKKNKLKKLLIALAVLAVILIPAGIYYAATSYTITFNPNGGTYRGTTANTTSTAQHGSTVTFAAAPTRTGYSFNGWAFTTQTMKTYTDGSGATFSHTSGKWSSYSGGVTSNGYTKYKGTIGTNVSGDNWIMLNFPKYTAYAGEKITISGDWRINSCPVEIWISHFWFKNDWSGQMWYYNPSANWRTFSYSRTANETYTGAYIDFTTASLPGISNFTYDVDFKNIKFERSATNYSAASFICYTGDMTATAQWTPHTYTVTYNANGGTGTTGNSSHTYGTAANLTANGFSRTGYTFNGWNTAANGTGTAYANQASVSNLTATNGGTVTLYAQWKPNSYSFTYYPNGGTGNNITDAYNYNSAYTVRAANTYSRTGYTFTTWNTAANGTGTNYAAGTAGTWTSLSNVGLYAQWQLNTYTIKYNANGGSGSMANTAATYGTNVALRANAFTRPGYTFKGWATTTTGGVSYGNGATVNSLTATANGTVNLYAVWEKQDFTIVYHINGGNTLNGGTAASISKTIKYEAAVDLSVTATRNKMKFIGWGVTPTSKVPISSIPSFILTGDKTSNDNAYKNYVSNNTLNLYALYSYEVSDIKSVTFAIWNTSNPTGTLREYPMTRTQTLTGSYIYALQNANVSAGLTSVDWSVTQYCIYVKDNAGNITVIAGPPPPVDPEEYAQIVSHMVWNIEEQKYELVEKTTEYIRDGSTYTPVYLQSLLTWNNGESKPAAYKVTQKNEITVTYRPKALTVVLNAQGGKFDDGTTTKNFTTYMDTLYGEMESPTRPGYVFKGWYTGTNGTGTKVDASHRYPYPNASKTQGPTTLYAKWEIVYYNVDYNFAKNLGERMVSTPVAADTLKAYGNAINLGYQAYRAGWEFIGWNTNPDSTQAMTSTSTWECEKCTCEYCAVSDKISSMPDHDVTLYALFKKTIALTCKDIKDEHKFSGTIYNDVATTYTFNNLPAGCEENDWLFKGWTAGTGAQSPVNAGAGSSYTLPENGTLYALYEKEVTVSYDTKNPQHSILDETKKAYYNASGNTIEAEFVIEPSKELTNNKFMYWYDEDGNRYYPGDVIKVTKDIHLSAHWDEFPSLVVFERYFTLSQAQAGQITEEELMNDMMVEDKEDDAAGIPLNKGIDGFDMNEIQNLTNTTDIRITYWVEDSAGTRVEKEMVFHVVKTEVSIDTKATMSRFISAEYFNTPTAGVFVSEENGGLKNNSTWKNNLTYSSLLTSTLAMEKTDVEVKDVSFGGLIKQMTVASSGTWNQLYSSHTYSFEEVKEMKNFILEFGFSRFMNAGATDTFITQFMEPNELN